jgi:hypothetical protein
MSEIHCGTCKFRKTSVAEPTCFMCKNNSNWEEAPEFVIARLEAENARLREALAKVDDYVEAYINGVEVGETGDKQYVYPGDEETYTGIADIVHAALNPPEVS